MSSRPHEAKPFGKLDNEVIVVHAIKRVAFEKVFVECWFEREASDFLMEI